MFYQPPPSKWGRWRATRAGRGACDGCRFLTIERQCRPWRPYHRCAVPLPRGERSTSSNHTSLTLVFLGRFPIRPVSQSASSYGLASWTGQQRGRLGLRVSVPLRGCGFEIQGWRHGGDHEDRVSVPLRGCGFEMEKILRFNACFGFPSPCGDVVLKYWLSIKGWAADEGFRPLAGMWF